MQLGPRGFRRSPALISRRDWTGVTSVNQLKTRKLTLKRLPKDYIANEINLNKKNYIKKTPLSQATRAGHIEIMEILVRAGASLDVEIEIQSMPRH